MRKIYSIFLLMLLPLLAVAQDNKAISASFSSSGTYTTHNRLQIPLEAAGMHRNVSGDDFESFATSYSFGMWFKLTGYYANSGYYTADSNSVLADFGTSSNSNNNGNWTISVDSNGALKLGGHGADVHGLGQMNSTLASSVSLDEWHYVLLTIDNTGDNAQVAVYYDGTQVLNRAATGKVYYPWGDGDGYNIHAFGLGTNGALDEIQLWNRALTESEATTAQINAQGVSGLTALYTFNEEVSTGTFANQAVGGGDYNAVYQALTGSFYSDGGLVPVSSATATATTLVDGREIVPTEASVTLMEMEGGVLTASDGETDYATANDPYTILTGTTLTLNATPNDGYSLIGIYAVDANDNRTEIANGGSYVVVGDVTIAASFTAEKYALTVNNELNVPYTLTYGGEAVTDLTQLMGGGAEYKLTLNVPENLILESVQLDGQDVAAVNGVYTLTFDADATLTINARNKAEYTVTINQPQGGTVTVSKGTTTINSGDKVFEGDVLTLSNTKDAGYMFANYIVNGNSTSSETITVNGDVTISALFEEGLEYCDVSNLTTSQSRHTVTSIVLTDGISTLTVDGAGTSGSRSQYSDQTDKVLVTKAGATINITLNAAGTWIHNYFYVDYNRNGVFDVDQSQTSVNGDLVSHTGYNLSMKSNNSDTADPTTCSDGYSLDNDHPWAHVPSFTLPADLAPGTYRMRYKMDWNSTDPCGRLDNNLYTGQASGNGIATHGTPMIDFTIRIESDDYETARTITVASDNELGTVAITSPETTGSSVSTTQKNVTVKATPANDAAFINWTDAENNVVSTDATYTYTGENDIELTAHFGYTLNYTVGSEGSAVVKVNGAVTASGSAFAPGAEVEITVNAPTGKEYLITLDGTSVQAEDNVFTFTLEANADVQIQFVDRINHISYTISGNGTVEIWTGVNGDSEGIPAGNQLQNGDVIPANSELFIWFIPNEGEELTSVTVTNGDDQSELTNEVDYYIPYDMGSAEETDRLAKAYFYPVPSIDGDIELSLTFSDNTQGIEEIGIDPADGPVEYYNLQGVRVDADNLVPGFYIVRQGSKAVKVLINK